MNGLLSCDNVVPVFRTDSPTLGRVDDCVMNNGMNSACQQNPFVVCQILDMYAFVSGSRMGHWQDCVERRHGGMAPQLSESPLAVLSREQDSGRVSGHSGSRM
jgi:hypothetical protein